MWKREKELLRYLKLIMSHKFRIIKDIAKKDITSLLLAAIMHLMYKLKKAIVLRQINLWFQEFPAVVLDIPWKKIAIKINRRSIPNAESKSFFMRREMIPAAKKENKVERSSVSLSAIFRYNFCDYNFPIISRNSVRQVISQPNTSIAILFFHKFHSRSAIKRGFSACEIPFLF